MKPLAIIPTYVRKAMDVDVFRTALRSLRDTASDRCDVIVIDDGSPERDLVSALEGVCEQYGAELVAKSQNEGFSKTINVGLRRALVEERHAILVNSDIEFGLTEDWLGLMEHQLASDEQTPAGVVGALLIYPNGLIQHGGIFFSMLTRDFGHRFNYGPGNLPEAQVATVCPVTGALQFIRYETLRDVGLYDEGFRMGWEDVDYCVRVFLAGRECIYQPGVRALHHEGFTRFRRDPKLEQWMHESWLYFAGKWATTNFSQFVPDMLAG